MKYRIAFLLFVLSLILCSHAAQAAVCGRADIGPAYIHIDILESGKTIKRFDLAGIKSDATIVLMDDYGWCLKPSILYGNAGGKRGEVASAGIGFGHCTPITDCLTITPSVGISYGYVRTQIKIPQMALLLGKERFTEIFRSVSPYLGLDISFKFWDKWRICGIFQYAWSNTKTNIKGLLKDKSSAKGANYALLLEYDVDCHWSVQLGAAYNISLSKEKHGIRAAGAKVGVAYWF